MDETSARKYVETTCQLELKGLWFLEVPCMLPQLGSLVLPIAIRAHIRPAVGAVHIDPAVSDGTYAWTQSRCGATPYMSFQLDVPFL